MNARVIDHDEAVKSLMAERYLLGELNAGERDAYEEHLFGCEACFQQVKTGTDLIGQLRHVGSEVREVPLASGFLPRLLRSATQPLTITVFGFLLFATGFAIHQSAVIFRLKEPRPEIRSVLTGVAHGSDETNVLKVPRSSGLSLNVEYARKGEFTSYRAQILSVSGKKMHEVVLSGNQIGTMASIAVPADALEPGPYSVVVFGRRSDGTQEEVGRGAFVLQFTD
jgi:hypothetical protein